MAALSRAQRKLADRMTAGARVLQDPKTGRFVLDEFGMVSRLDQRPVETMLLSGALEKDCLGHCRLVVDPSDRVSLLSNQTLLPGDSARWSSVERGELKFRAEVTVVSATRKQALVRTGGGDYRVVRIGALDRVADVPGAVAQTS